MTEAGRLQAILDTLNAYEAEGVEDIWQEVIYHLPELNEDATNALGYTGDHIVLDLDDDDERVTISYDYPRGKWVADS